ncbi:hypothetical protein QA644_32030 (plasmid) [Rhizobium sp. CC1099]|nr:hypothetical protein [Rhizobium sp. CC1099]WFU91962.1 hypothetical protein QA644_32030 [Rhizobium sp. CC1099]
MGDVLDKTGVERMVILRGLPICDYSFGFTRVSATPVYNREYQNRNVPMPVRLVAFDPFEDGKRPIYVTQQNNEALYVKLDEGPPESRTIGGAREISRLLLIKAARLLMRCISAESPVCAACISLRAGSGRSPAMTL